MTPALGTPWLAVAGTLRELPRNARLYIAAEVPMAVGAGAFSTVYNLFVLARGHDPAFLGLLLAATLVGAGGAALPAGALVDRRGPRAVLLVASLLTAVGVAAQLALPLAPVLLAGSAVAGAGVGGFYVAAAPFLAESTRAGRRTGVFTLDVVAVLAGRAVGSAAGGEAAGRLLQSGGVAGAEGYRLTLVGAALITATAIVPLLMTRPPRLPGRSGLPSESSATGIAGSRLEALDAPLPPPERRVPWERWRSAVADPLVSRLALVGAVTAGGSGLILPYANVFFVEGLQATAALFGWLSAAALLLRSATTLWAPWLARRFGTVRAAAGVQLAAAPLLLLLGFAPSVALAGAALLLCWSVTNLVGPLQSGITMDTLPAEARGAGNSVVWLATYGASGLGAVAGGLLIGATGYRVPYAVAAAVAALSALLLLRLLSAPELRPQEARPVVSGGGA